MVYAEEYLTCPYNSNHRIRRERFQYHLVKCHRKHKLTHDLSVCPFEATHRVSEPEMLHHVSTCNNRRVVDDHTLIARVESPCIKPQVEQKQVHLPEPEEDWDSEPPPAGTYNPEVKLCGKVFRAIRGATKAERKYFRQMERLKFQRLEPTEEEKEAQRKEKRSSSVPENENSKEQSYSPTRPAVPEVLPYTDNGRYSDDTWQPTAIEAFFEDDWPQTETEPQKEVAKEETKASGRVSDDLDLPWEPDYVIADQKLRRPREEANQTATRSMYIHTYIGRGRGKITMEPKVQGVRNSPPRSDYNYLSSDCSVGFNGNNAPKGKITMEPKVQGIRNSPPTSEYNYLSSGCSVGLNGNNAPKGVAEEFTHLTETYNYPSDYVTGTSGEGDGDEIYYSDDEDESDDSSSTKDEEVQKYLMDHYVKEHGKYQRKLKQIENLKFLRSLGQFLTREEEERIKGEEETRATMKELKKKIDGQSSAI